MEIKARYHQGILKPLEQIEGVQEGEVIEITIHQDPWNTLAMKNPSFTFLEQEPDIYTEKDIITEK